MNRPAVQLDLWAGFCLHGLTVGCRREECGTISSRCQGGPGYGADRQRVRLVASLLHRYGRSCKGGMS